MWLFFIVTHINSYSITICELFFHNCHYSQRIKSEHIKISWVPRWKSGCFLASLSGLTQKKAFQLTEKETGNGSQSWHLYHTCISLKGSMAPRCNVAPDMWRVSTHRQSSPGLASCKSGRSCSCGRTSHNSTTHFARVLKRLQGSPMLIRFIAILTT